MKQINKYILERLQINKNIGVQSYNYHPKTKDELKELVDKLIKERGNKADLNDINTSKIIDMSELFFKLNFNGDISNWDVSNVKNMSCMFEYSKFTGKNGDISKWNVSNVENMSCMFRHSKFNGDISKWDVSNVEDINCMFAYSKFTGENGDISNWNIAKVKYMNYIFEGSPLEKNTPKWYKK